MDLILSWHGRAATALVLFYTAIGIWGLVLGARNAAPSPSFRGAIVVGVVASVVQGLLGLAVFAFLRPPPDGLHLLYGLALTLAMPLAATLVRGQTSRGQSVALGLAALFTAGLAVRGIVTA